MSNTMSVVIREDRGRFEISGHDGVRGMCVLPWDAHFCTTLAEVVAKLDTMIATYGWTVTSVTHRLETGAAPVWTPVR